MTEMASNPQEISKEDLKTDVCPTSKVTDLMSHDELVQFFQESLKMLVKMDPLLKDVRPDITLDEIGSLLALENGQAMTIFIDREPCAPWKVVVLREATVHQLKQALKRHVSLSLTRRNNFKKISWKYIWRTYWLAFEGTKLMDDKKLTTYGITNKSRLDFVKKLKKRNT